MFEAICWAIALVLGFGTLNALWIALFLKTEALREQQVPVEQQEPLALALAAPFAHAHS